MLDRIEIQLEAVTPVFLHVEPEGEARWRAAPFRGLARWWFRAVVGASSSLDRVREREIETFGAAERASPVMFRITNPKGASRQFEINPGSSKSARRHALPPGSTATLILQANPWADNAAVVLRQTYAAVWLALHLGGIGQRCRRGAGSLRIKGVKFPSGWDDLPGAFDLAGSSPSSEHLAEHLRAGIAAVRRELGVTPRDVMGPEADYPVLHHETACVKVSYLEVQENGSPPAERARLKLMNLRRNRSWHTSGSEPEFGGIKPRLASPLWLRIAEVFPAQNGKHRALVVATLLRHAGARGATWARVEEMLKSSDFKDTKQVTL